MLTLKEEEKTRFSYADRTDAGRELRGEAHPEGGCCPYIRLHTPYICLSKPSLSTCPLGACVSGKPQSQHVSSGGVRVRSEEGQPGSSGNKQVYREEEAE